MENIDEFKKKIKKNIISLIDLNFIKEANELIDQYEAIDKYDEEIVLIKADISTIEGNYDEVERLLKEGLCINGQSVDLNYNLAKLYEIQENFYAAYKFYQLAYDNSKNKELRDYLLQKIQYLSEEKKVFNNSNNIIDSSIKRRKVLMFAYFFPPVSGSGVQRTLKFVKYIREFGWEPIVVTIGNTGHHFMDSTLLQEVPHDIRVHRIAETNEINSDIVNELYSLCARLVKNSELLNYYIEILKKGNGIQNILMPDKNILWANNVLKQIHDLIDFREIDMIYTTSGPYSDHIIGYFLSEKYNKPWVADFRDEWTNNPYRDLDENSFLYRMFYAMESEILNRADKVITVTPSSVANYLDIFSVEKSKISLITNGYDESDFSKNDFKNSVVNSVFTITHNGLFYSIRTPETFLTALSNLVKKGLIDKNKVKVNLGWIEEKEKWQKYIDSHMLNDTVIINGYMEHHESLKLAFDSDLLLLVLGPGEKNKGIYPAKLFEYLRLCKPILSLGPNGSIAQKLISEFDRGFNVDFNNVKSIEQYILFYYNKWIEGETDKLFLDNKIEKYERKYLSSQLVNEFDEMYNKYESRKKMKKLAFFSIKNGEKFLRDIIPSLNDEYITRLFIIERIDQIEEAMSWADICWFEWCDDIISYASNLELARNKKIICRILGYEAYTENAKKVNWKNVDRLVFVSEHLKMLTSKMIEMDVVKTEVLENGVDLDKYQYKNNKKNYNIAFVGGIVHVKNPAFLLQILKQLVEINKNYKLFVAGEYKDIAIKHYIDHLVKEMNLEEHYIYDGYQDNIDKWLEDKSFLLATSYRESFGYLIAEAMAKGIKPVIHNFPFSEEIWPKQYIFNTIKEAVGMIESSEYDSRAYREYIINRYSLDKQVIKIKKLLESVLKSNKEEKSQITFGYKDNTVTFYLPNLNDYIQKTIYNNNTFYEIEMLEDINFNDISDKVVIDVGANIGNHTIFFSKIGQAKKVYCFEPYKEVYNMLTKNIELNNMENQVEAFNLAVGRIAGKANIDIVDKDNLGMNRVIIEDQGTVRVVSLDEIILPLVDNVDILKVDVEGMGMEVLYGAVNIIEKYKPSIYIEAETEMEFYNIQTLLSLYKYHPIKRYNWTPTYLFEYREE